MPGIKIEEVTGGAGHNGKLWREMARQVYCENGREAYREIGHYRNGAPFLYGDPVRISITHCDGLFAVATLPATPEVELSEFSRRAALGIDAERRDRGKVVGLRRRFLNDDELQMIPEDDVETNVIAWTIKEAAYKAAMTPGLDFRNDIRIVRMPRLGPPTPVFEPEDFGLAGNQKNLPDDFFGEAVIVIDKVRNDFTEMNDKDGSARKPSEVDGGVSSQVARSYPMRVYSYLSDEFVVTLCYHAGCAKFGKSVV